LLAQAAGSIGDVQVRNMGTIGGSLAHADPAADYPAAVLASGAHIVVRGAGGERVIEAGSFFLELFLTSLQPGEIITEVRIPAQPAGAGACYVKFPHPASRFAVVGCAAVVAGSGGVCTEARVAFTGVANAAFRDAGVEAALAGKPLDGAAIDAAAALAAHGVEVLSDSFAGADYRRHLATVFAGRALRSAARL
jgi:carbon-monoxide dehydrogenase medium subunit